MWRWSRGGEVRQEEEEEEGEEDEGEEEIAGWDGLSGMSLIIYCKTRYKIKLGSFGLRVAKVGVTVVRYLQQTVMLELNAYRHTAN